MLHCRRRAIGCSAPFWLSLALMSQSAPETIFDGATLSGWDGDLAVWTVRDGCVVGTAEPGLPQHNTHLIWRGGELTDFELSFSVRLDGDNNSGVQYRSRRLGDAGYAVAGPQCDVHGAPGYLGMLYDEGGRGITATAGQRVAFGADGTKRILDEGATPRAQDLSQWHAIRIVARGTTMQHFVDGALAVEVVDDSPSCVRKGILALQVHSGPKSAVWFKELKLQRLPPVEIATTSAGSLGAVDPLPNWIWDATAEADEEVFFRRVFQLGQQPKSALLHVTCDNHCRVYVNGERVTQSDAWELPRRVDVQKWLRAGENVLAVHAWNDGGAAGMCAQLRWRGDGGEGAIVTDATWSTAADDPDGWNKGAFAAASWSSAHVVAELGEGPWAGAVGTEAFAADADGDVPQSPQPTAELDAPSGWTRERLFAVPRTLGSWVCMCIDDQGRLYASDQNRGLYRITPAGVLSRTDTVVERIELDLDGCQGLCWAFGALYAVQNHGKPGLCRVTDRNGDDVLDHVELLRTLPGDGEHGPHAVEIAPDGEHLLVLCGNHVLPPDLEASRVPRPFVEDVLVPGINDPNGHAVGITAPGGYVCQVDKDGKNWELYCCGFRNAYDLAVLPSGDVVTFDADMEWDMGLPWYRPTRILQVLSGVDYGWRTGSRKWGADVPDSLPAVCDIGPASPTGMVAFADGVLALDWTFGTAYGVTLSERGAMLQGRAQPFSSGKPLPLTDVVVDRERGRVYLLTGGRGLPSKLYRLTNASGLPELVSPPSSPARARRLELETFHGRADARALAVVWPFLGSDDLALRSAARLAVEAQPVDTWRGRALAERASTWSQLTALVALARCGGAVDLESLLAALAGMDFAAMDPLQKVAWLRAHELALMRLQPVSAATALAVGQRLLPLFPSANDRLDQMLVGLLAHVDERGLLDRAVPMLVSMTPASPPPWAAIAERNSSYGGAIAKLLSAMPPSQQIAIDYALRSVKAGWTFEQRQTYFQFLGAAKKQKGGASYLGFLQRILDDAYATCSEAEKAELAEVVGAARAEQKPFVSTPPKGPGRRWTLEEAMAIARAEVLSKGDVARGRNLFFATGCAGCHRFAGEGSGVGPDLTSLGNKFSAADVLEAILDPSKVVSDQFAGAVLTRKDGSTVFGRVAQRGDGAARVYEVVTATADAAVVRVPGAEVAGVAAAKLSPMPAGLIDRLNEQELIDLLVFLLSRGQ